MKIYTSFEDYKRVQNPIATIGTFDGVHVGHQKIINRLKEIAREENGEVVLLTFHPHPRMVLQPAADLHLINSQREKIEFLEKAGIEHLIIYPFTKAFSRLTAVEYVRDILVNQMKIKRLVIGYDHQFGRNREGNFEHLLELAQLYGFEVEEIPAQMINDVNVSSTKIRKALDIGDLDTVKNALNRPFTLTGTVVPGNKKGRLIGFPTANIQIEEATKIIPSDGVYAVRVQWNGRTFKGMLNIGVKPTVSENGKRSIEVHIFDFDEEIYDRKLTLELVRRIRNEKQFDSLEALRSKLHEDKIETLRIFETC